MGVIYSHVGGKELHDFIAHMPGVVEGVHRKGDEALAIAEGIFAKHDRPGGHRIIGEYGQQTDAYVILEGPVPHIVEYGRAGYVTKKTQRLGSSIIPAGTVIGPWEGTHVLRRTMEAL